MTEKNEKYKGAAQQNKSISVQSVNLPNENCPHVSQKARKKHITSTLTKTQLNNKSETRMLLSRAYTSATAQQSLK